MNAVMNRWKQRIISLLLVISMVFGLTQGNVLQVEAASTENLSEADGIIWLAKNESGDSVSQEFSDMVQKQLKLDDMVRDAVNAPADTEVYYDGVNVGNAMDLYLNQSKLQSMIDEMKTAITDKKLVEFHLGSANGDAKKIAFRSIESVGISVNEDNTICVTNAGAPANAKALEEKIQEALNSAVVSVDHSGTVITTGIYAENKAGFEATFTREGGASYSSLLKKWPTATLSPEANTKKAGTVTITIYAAEHSQYPNDRRFKKTETFNVVMVDQRIKVNAAAVDSANNYVQDEHLQGLTKTYSVVEPGVNEQPVSDYYTFVKFEQGVCDGYDYTAVMKPKKDNNKNGIHDDLETLEKFTVTYYVDNDEYATEQVEEGSLPKGPTGGNPTKEDSHDEETGKTTKYTFAGWNTQDDGKGTKWPAKVTDNVNYYATWTETVIEDSSEEPEASTFTVTGTLVIGNTAAAPQPLAAEMRNDGSTGSYEYKITDPGWAESLAMDGYKCVGWYYKVSEGSEGAEDINKDGKSEEKSFKFDEIWTTGDNETLELHCQFLETIEVYDPERGETEEVKGNATATYNYTIVDSAGNVIKRFTTLSQLTEGDLEDLPVPEYNARVSTFKGWKVTEAGDNSYKLMAEFNTVRNTVSEPENLVPLNPSEEIDESGVTYTLNGYTSTITIDSMASVNENGEAVYTYAVDSDTTVSITPFRTDNQEILYYVTGLKAFHTSVGNNGIDIPVTYDEDYNAEATGIYEAIKNSARTGESLTGVELVPQYAPFKFAANTSASLAANQTKYDAKTVYNTVLDTLLTYDAEKVTVLYKAQEDSYQISLNKLFDLLEKDGLGSLKDMIGEQYDSLQVAVPAGHDTWKSVGDISKEVTAQEAANEYLEQKYQEYKSNKDMDILQFVGEVVEGLSKAVYSNAHHKFGYISPVNTENPTEVLRITYKSDAISASAELTVALNDHRSQITITGSNVTCEYGSGIEAAIKKAVVCNPSVTGNLVTYDAATNTIRDYSGVGVGTYQVKVAFMGNATYRPAMSDAFTLTVKAAKTTIEVPDLVTMEGNAKDPSAKVTPDAPIVQVIAGIAADELAYGLQTDGDVKDWKLGFDDENLMIDMWVKLPQSYIELLENLDLLNLKEYGVELPVNRIEEGKYYKIEDLETALESYDISAVQELQAILDQIPAIIQDKLGLSGLTYGVKVRFDALEKEVYPTNPGFYVNYAATLSRFNYINSSNIVLDKNYEAAEDYGFIVISPMAPLPNRGGVQLYDGNVNNAKNVFVYEYDGGNTSHKLKVAVNGTTLEGKEPFYYGLTTGLDAKKTAPTKPGVYFAGFNYTTTVKNEDSGEMEVRRLGSDSAIIVIKPQKANLTIKGDVYTHEAGEKHFAEIKITDKSGKEIKNAAVTIISGAVNVKEGTTNATAGDFYGTINVDFPNAIQKKWDAFWENAANSEANEVKPSDLIRFLEECRDASKAAADTALDGFETLAMKDAVSSALAKLNVNSGTLVDQAEIVRAMLNTSVAYYNKLLEQLEPLKKLDDNAKVTFYDLENENDKLAYDQVGYYLYLGVTTDPDLTVDAGKGMVIICTEDDYIMHDTYVPYNGKEQTIELVDETKSSDVIVMVNNDKNEISFFLDDKAYADMNKVLGTFLEKGTINEGSDVKVSTVYDKAEGYAEKVYDALFDSIWTNAETAIKKAHMNTAADALQNALAVAKDKLKGLTTKLSDKLQAMDKLDGNTRIILYQMSDNDDLQGMPINAGTYEFYGYAYDVAATRGTLVIEPICIEVDDNWTKTYGDDDPSNAWDCIQNNIRYYYVDADGVEQETTLPENDEIDSLLSYNSQISRDEGEDAGSYKMWIENLQLNDDSGNYKLVDLTNNDEKDFVIEPKKVDLEAVVTLDGTFVTEIVAGQSPVVKVSVIDETTGLTEDDITYTVTNAEGTTVTWDVAISTPGVYTITPAVKDSVTNYVTGEVTSVTLTVKKLKASAYIGPKEDSEIFKLVEDAEATYKLYAGYTAETIRQNLNFGAKDELGYDTGLTVTLEVKKQESLVRTLLRALVGNDETADDPLAALAEPGTYTVTTVTAGYDNIYESFEEASITVIVEEVMGTISKGKWKMDLDSVVYLNYYPTIQGFHESFNFADPERAGVVIWTGDTPPVRSDQLEVGKDDTMVVKGWIKDVNGEWCAQTPEIYAKNLGDMVYIRPYVVDYAGNYVYTPNGYSYSPMLFAYDVMNEWNATEKTHKREKAERNLCAALLQYGAAAQEYFGYDTDNLVTNKSGNFEHVAWEDYREALEYTSAYVDTLVTDDTVKALADTLAIDENKNVGVTRIKTVLDLAGAIRMHVGYNIDTSIIKLEDIDKAEVLFWNERDFARIIENENSLEYKYQNYNFKYDLVEASDDEEVYVGDYIAKSDYIVAKYLGETVYCTCRIQMKDGTVYNSGLACYSPDAFAGDHISQSQGPVVELSKGIIVYGEMAKIWFIGND